MSRASARGGLGHSPPGMEPGERGGTPGSAACLTCVAPAVVHDDPAQQPQRLPSHVLGAAPPAAPLQRLHETLNPLGQLRGLVRGSWHLERSRRRRGIPTCTTSELALPGRTRPASAPRGNSSVYTPGHAPSCLSQSETRSSSFVTAKDLRASGPEKRNWPLLDPPTRQRWRFESSPERRLSCCYGNSLRPSFLIR